VHRPAALRSGDRTQAFGTREFAAMLMPTVWTRSSLGFDVAREQGNESLRVGTSPAGDWVPAM
jgi:hypothetical protein